MLSRKIPLYVSFFIFVLSCNTINSKTGELLGSSNDNLSSSSQIQSETSSSTPPATNKQAKDPSHSLQYSVNSKIHVIDASSFRVEVSYPEVWDALLSVLIRNYNIVLADSVSGIISTDWDSYYLRDQTLRNRISVKVKKLSYKNTELIFHNSVEKLKTSTSSSVWLPEPDKYNEVERVLNNVAILLNLPSVKISHLSVGQARKVIQR